MKGIFPIKERLLLMTKFLVILLCILMAGLLLFMTPVLWKMPIHNMKLNVFENNFAKISHPRETELVAKMKDFGLFGNSNHCDYIVGEYRTSNLQRETIINHYKGLHIPPPDDSLGVWDGPPPKKTDIEIYFTDDRIFEHWPWSEWMEEHLNRLTGNRENTYLVLASEDGYPPIGDFRCH